MEHKYVNGKIMKENKNNKFDEYFTKEDIAQYLFLKTKSIIAEFDNIEDFLWLEPSVGDGAFYKLLPEAKRVGIDINKTDFDTIQMDYLNYELPNTKAIIIGNPPFGHRGVLALNFINHSIKADYVAFILPMFFQSVGKGSIRYRVKGFNLLFEEMLPKNSFYDKNTLKDVDVKCCFQIWSKQHRNEKDDFSWYLNKAEAPFSDLLDVVTVSLAPKRECGKEYIFNKRADFYLSSSFFGDISVVKEFSDVKYKSGIAIIYKTKNERIISNLNRIFKNANWERYSSLATNGARHIGKSHIFKLLYDSGVKNETRTLWNSV